MLHDPTPTLIELERQFWQSQVDGDINAALALLHEPALMVTAQGPLQFDHAQYRQMAQHGPMALTAFQLSDMKVMFPNEDTAVLTYRVHQTRAERGRPASGAVTQLMADASVWTRKGGRWRCVMHTETGVTDAAADA